MEAIRESEGRPEWAVIPYPDFQRMLEQLEDLDDIRAYDQAKRELASGEDELIPLAVVERLDRGESPLRVWREHLGG